jgi:hypothetical protein
MEKQPELFKKEKIRLRNGQYASLKQKAIDDKIFRAKLTELQNRKLERENRNQKNYIEILENKLQKLQNGRSKNQIFEVT